MNPRRVLLLATAVVAVAAMLQFGCSNKSSKSQSTPAAPTATVAAPPDHSADIRAALPAYVAAVGAPDGAYLYAHLHQTALHHYGVDACRAWFNAVTGDLTFAIDVHSISGPAPWTWQVYGETLATIPGVYTLQVTMTRNGQPAEAEVHFVWDTEQIKIVGFSPCVRPPQ